MLSSPWHPWDKHTFLLLTSLDAFVGYAGFKVRSLHSLHSFFPWNRGGIPKKTCNFQGSVDKAGGMAGASVGDLGGLTVDQWGGTNFNSNLSNLSIYFGGTRNYLNIVRACWLRVGIISGWCFFFHFFSPSTLPYIVAKNGGFDSVSCTLWGWEGGSSTVRVKQPPYDHPFCFLLAYSS